MTDRCAVPGCRAEVELIYLGHGVCDNHWNQLADDASREGLRVVLGLSATPPPAVEVDMSETENIAAENAAQEEAMPMKKAEPKAPKKTRAAKAAKPTQAKKTTKPAKQPKARKERPPKEDLCVFACRVAEAERVAFHKASGPAGASRFARKLFVVFSNADEAGFRALLKEARELRG